MGVLKIQPSGKRHQFLRIKLSLFSPHASLLLMINLANFFYFFLILILFDALWLYYSQLNYYSFVCKHTRARLCERSMSSWDERFFHENTRSFIYLEAARCNNIHSSFSNLNVIMSKYHSIWMSNSLSRYSLLRLE